MTTQGKQVLGAVARLVHNNPVALKHLFVERVASLVLYSLPACPPSTVYAYSRIRGLTRFATRLISNVWKRDADVESLRVQYGLPDLVEKGLILALTFLFDCLVPGPSGGVRRFGAYLELRTEPPRRSLRSSASVESGMELVIPYDRRSRTDKLQPIRLAKAWNSLPLRELFPPDGLRISKAAFVAKLPQLISDLPGEIRESFGLPFQASATGSTSPFSSASS